MASRLGPHGLMSVKCLYAYTTQSLIVQATKTGAEQP